MQQSMASRFQFHLYSKDANFVNVTGSIFFQSAIDFKKNRIFEPKRFSQKTTQILQDGISPALSLSYICSLPFWTNKRILHFYLTDFRFCLVSSLKATKIFIVDKWNYEGRFDVSKKGLNLLLSYVFLSARNSEFRGEITIWWHSEANLFRSHFFLYCSSRNSRVSRKKKGWPGTGSMRVNW